MTLSPISHPVLHRALACLLTTVLLVGTLAPAAFGAVSLTGTAAAKKAKKKKKAKKPKCRKTQKLVRVKKRVRVWKKVRVKGKMRRKRVWVKKSVLVCVAKKKKKATVVTSRADTQAPSLPAGLLAAPGNGQVTLVWSPSSDDVGVTGYRVYRDGVLVASPAAAMYTDVGLTNGRLYTYGIVALDAAGNASATATVTATPKTTSDLTAPSAPPNFKAVAGDRQVALSWDAASDNIGVVYYELRRDGAPIAFQEGRTFTDLALVNGTSYTYTVLAYDAANNASPVSTVSGTPADTTAPSVPAGLAATPGNGQVSLTWTASTDNVGVTGYRVFRDNVLVASPTTAYYSDTGLTNGTACSYKVVAVDGSANASAATAPVIATPAAPNGSDTQAPTVPTNLAGTPGTGQVSLTWTASTDNVGVTGYKVYRDGSLIASPAGPSYVDTGRTNGTAYSYTVAAVDAAGNISDQTAAISVTPGDTQAPTVPTGITLTKNNAAHSITVAWTASTDNVGVVRYRVYRKINTGAYTMVAQPTTTSYGDIDLANGKTYSYTVSAVDAAGNESAQSPAVTTYVS